MTNIGSEFLTLLSGARMLIDAGEIDSAEHTYRQLHEVAQSVGNEEEKALCSQTLIRFLQSRGRSEEALQLASASGIKANQTKPDGGVKEVILIGSSAGGVEAVSVVLGALPKNLPAAVFVVQQVPGHSPSDLAKMFDERSALPVTIPADGEATQPGRVYLAPPNKHLIVKRGSICLGNGPKENRARPAIDVMFRTAAHAYGSGVIAVVLSGVLNDGTAGLMSVKTHGGKSIVQDPDEAVFDGMPRSAIRFVSADHVTKAGEIGALVGSLIADGLHDEGELTAMPEYRDQADVGEVGGPGIGHVAPYAPSALTCPACGGAVWEIQEQSLTLFKCHVGHSYTAELMLEEQSEVVDATAWALLRAIEESVHLRRKLAEWARNTGRMDEAHFHNQQAENAQKQSEAFRSLILSDEKGRD